MTETENGLFQVNLNLLEIQDTHILQNLQILNQFRFDKKETSIKSVLKAVYKKSIVTICDQINQIQIYQQKSLILNINYYIKRHNGYKFKDNMHSNHILKVDSRWDRTSPTTILVL